MDGFVVHAGQSPARRALGHRYNHLTGPRRPDRIAAIMEKEGGAAGRADAAEWAAAGQALVAVR
jgi:hypothetical protein